AARVRRKTIAAMPAPIRSECDSFGRDERIVELLLGRVSLITPALNVGGAHKLKIETRCAPVRNCSLSTMLANCPGSGKACETRAEHRHASEARMNGGASTVPRSRRGDYMRSAGTPISQLARTECRDAFSSTGTPA